ncbi:MAG: T9SS type A sorting domain-containing protein [Ignavibacteriae bacterium]|nr:T9SS type A sorting domain-containing protein [Ignavibacteriota bacterium]
MVGCYISGVLYGDTSNITYSISGTVKYNDNNQPVTSGWVKAIKLDKNTSNIIILDSAAIQSDGSYTLTKVPQDSVDIGIYPNSTPPNDWVISYYPSTIYWQNAITLYPTGNLTNINIGAIRMTPATNNNSVNGKVMRLTDNPLANLKDAVLYAKNGNTFVRCVVSDGNGVYHLNSLPTGNLKIIVNRLGFTNDSTMVNVTATSNIDSINFYLYRVPVGIKQIGSTVPSEYKLYQNYPNPFNPSTIIKFQIKDSRFTTLKIYNILGKEVATLVNEKQSPGVYEVVFDALNLPSGIYFYKLVAGDFVETKRMVLIK